MKKNRFRSTAAALGSTALAIGTLAACGGGSPGNDANEGDDVSTSADGDTTIVWWHNGTGEPLLSFWDDIAQEFSDEHGVNVEAQAYQNEDLQRTLIPNQLRTGEGLDLFQQWGAGELAAQVDAGYVKDVSDELSAVADELGGSISPWQYDGKTYGIPYNVGIEGFWYDKELFAEAGIDATPETLDELYAVIDKLKAAGITPISVGAGDGWPAAHYWYNFALKSCSPEILEKAESELDFSDPCFIKAGEFLQEFIEHEPFQDGYLATSAQQGAGSSAGMLATGEVAMELMGHWNPGVMGGILQEETDDENATPPEFLGWFNFPGIDGAPGDPNAALGGGDGFSCTAWAPPECVELLKYLASEDVQSRFAETGAGVPVTPGSDAGLADDNLQQVYDGLQEATYLQLWLDTAYGPAVGEAMNNAVVHLIGGDGTPESIVEAMQDAAASL